MFEEFRNLYVDTHPDIPYPYYEDGMKSLRYEVKAYYFTFLSR